MSSSLQRFHSQHELSRFLKGLAADHLVSLQNYFGLDGFRRKCTDSRNTSSTMSTATCAVSLARAGKWSIHGAPWKMQTENVLRRLLRRDWASVVADEPGQVFKLAFSLDAANHLSAFVEEEGIRLAREEAANILLDQLRTSGKLIPASLHAPGGCGYLVQLAVRALSGHFPHLESCVLQPVVEWAETEVNRQLALMNGNGESADPAQLAYCIALIAGNTDPLAMSPERSRILRSAVESYFAAQREDGTWPRSMPLPLGGQAYCYEYEVLAQLLDCEALQSLLLPHLDKLERSARALDERSFDLAPGRGWQSGHQWLKGPESWSTASVYHFVHSLDRLLAEAVRRTAFEYLDHPYKRPERPESDESLFARRFLDCPLPEGCGQPSVREALLRCLVAPVARQAENIEKGWPAEARVPTCAILFGPPGTSKTMLAEMVADYLNWPFLAIDPSYFVKNGLDCIHQQADRLFTILSSLERVVVLLDEIDELVRNRDEAAEVRSRFLTTAMLPKLSQIHKSQRLIVIVATNHVESFDVAIRRRGRFDLVLQVMPPSCDEKRNLGELGSTLDQNSLSSDNEVEECLSRLTFLELEELLQRIGPATNLGANQIKSMILEEAENCTLAQPAVCANGEESKTWEDVCKEQEQFVRLPPTANDVDATALKRGQVSRWREPMPAVSHVRPNGASRKRSGKE